MKVSSDELGGTCLNCGCEYPIVPDQPISCPNCRPGNDFPEIVCGTCGIERCGPDVFRDDLCTFCALERLLVLEKEVKRLRDRYERG